MHRARKPDLRTRTLTCQTDEDHALGVSTTERLRLHKIVDKYNMSEADKEGACLRARMRACAFARVYLRALAMCPVPGTRGVSCL